MSLARATQQVHGITRPSYGVADTDIFTIDGELIAEEMRYDGYYAVRTNLEDEPAVITKICRGRWEIEESFRILKSDFKSRPVYHRLESRIKVRFITCYIALVIPRILEYKLRLAGFHNFTLPEI